MEVPRSSPGSYPETGQPLGVAFGGGGMKGWSHVGVISVLDRYGLQPSLIAGCSAGAIMGAYYAYGYSVEDMVRFMRDQRTSALFSLRFDGLGLFDNRALGDYLRQHFQDCTFEDLKTPFYVICTDLESGREVVLNSGPLVDAVLASSAMPGIFSPIEIGGQLLCDGGLCNNVPVSVLVSHGARYTIAVRLHRDTRDLSTIPLRRIAVHGEKGISVSLWAERLARSIRKDKSHLPNGLEVVSRALDLLVGQIERYRLQAYPPDVIITPEVSHIKTLSFSEEKEEIYKVGVEAAEAKADLLLEIARRLKG